MIDPAPPSNEPSEDEPVELSHFVPVRGEYPAVEEHPAGSPAEVPVLHATPVVALNPEAQVHPAGKFPVGAPIKAARDIAPTTPSATRP